MRDEGLVENAARVGGIFKAGLERLQRDFPIIDNARGRGLILAFDLPDAKARDGVRQRCWDAGLATLACGTRTLRFRPQLGFTESDTERALGIVRKVLGD
jgi:L-lysine 6-transaminase